MTAFALHPPGDRRAEITRELTAARDLQEIIAQRPDDRRSVGPDQSKLAEHDRETAALEARRDLHLNRAIRAALAAYGIVPVGADGQLKMPRGRTVFPGAEGREATWIALGRKNAPLQLILANGKVKKLPAVPPGKYAATTVTGLTVIIPEMAVNLSPDGLALVLIHEKRHFEAFTKTSEGDALTKGEREKLAIQAERDALDHIGLSADARRIFATRLRESMAKAEALAADENRLIESLLHKAGRLTGLIGDEAMADFRERRFGAAETMEEVERLKDEARALEQQLDAGARRRHFERLRTLAKRICFFEESPTQAELDDVRPLESSAYDVAALPLGTPCVPSVYAEMQRALSYGDGLRLRALESMAAGAWASLPQTTAALPATGGPIQAELSVAPTHPPMALFELAELARRACAQPGSVGREELRRLSEWFPAPSALFAESARKEVSGCAADLLDQLLEFNRTWSRGDVINADWLKQEAERLNEKHRPKPPPPVIDDTPPSRDRPAPCTPRGIWNPKCGEHG